MNENATPEKETSEQSAEKPVARGLKTEIWDFIRFAVIAALVVLPIRFWIAQPFIVHGSSMIPAFQNGDYLIIDEITYQFREPERGEVIVFKYPLNPSQFFIKRIAGVPGDTINNATLKQNEYYVLGDNHAASSDSRFWGPVKSDLIIGRAIVRLWPINAIRIF